MIDPNVQTDPANPAEVQPAEPTTSWPEVPVPEGEQETPAAAAPAQPSVDELRKEIAALEGRLSTEERRRQDSQAWGSQRANEAAIAEAVIKTLRQAEDERRAAAEREAAYHRSLAPPALSDDEFEALTADPKIAKKYIDDMANYGYKHALAAVHSKFAPVLDRATAALQVLPVLTERAIASTVRDVREMTSHAEVPIPPEQFDELVPHALRIIEERAIGSNQGHMAAAFQANPEMLWHAVYMARNAMARGVPITTKPKAPPTIGVGGDPPRNGGDGRTRVRRDDEVTKMENAMGHKFSDKDLRAARDRATAEYKALYGGGI